VTSTVYKNIITYLGIIIMQPKSEAYDKVTK